MSVAPATCSEAAVAAVEGEECDEELRTQNELTTQAEDTEEEQNRKREQSRLVRVENVTEMRALSKRGRKKTPLDKQFTKCQREQRKDGG